MSDLLARITFVQQNVWHASQFRVRDVLGPNRSLDRGGRIPAASQSRPFGLDAAFLGQPRTLDDKTAFFWHILIKVPTSLGEFPDCPRQSLGNMGAGERNAGCADELQRLRLIAVERHF